MYRKHPNHTYGRNRNNSANNQALSCFADFRLGRGSFVLGSLGTHSAECKELNGEFAQKDD